MNFIKTFLVTLVIYFGLNVLFAIIYVYTDPILSTLPDAGLLIVAMMFGPITTAPNVAWVDRGVISLIQSFQGGDPLMATLMFLYYVLPAIIAVIVGGIVADSTTIAFLSWFLIAIVGTIVYTIIMFVAGSDPLVSPSLYSLVYIYLWFLYGPTDLYIAMIFFGLINAFLYGCISFLVTRKKL
ncbi:MAG: hypothetical protein ACFFC1_03705 [Promethearchaeota archaeon]